MKIKTTRQIREQESKIKLDTTEPIRHLDRCVAFDSKKWVAVDDIIKELDKIFRDLNKPNSDNVVSLPLVATTLGNLRKHLNQKTPKQE